MNPNKDTPPEVIERLTAWGGLNRWGEPNWRIVLAQNHLEQTAGMWTEFEDTECAQETGTDWQMETKRIAPDAVRVGTFWMPIYPCEGWILERWFPPSAFGSREAWYSALSQDGETPMMGPYPERGRFWMLDGPWEEIPPLELVRVPISLWENNPQNMRGEIDEEKLFEVMRQAQVAAQEKEESDHAKLLEWATYTTENNLKMIKGNPALSALRNKIASQNGFHSHI